MGALEEAKSAFVERFRRGDPAALTDVYRTYVVRVTKTVASLLRRYAGGVDTDVADLVQETFVRAFATSARERYDGARDYTPYLLGIAHHVVINYLRSRRRSTDALAELTPAESTLMPASQERDFDAAQVGVIIAKYLARLPAELKQVHELIYVRGLSQRDAAAILGLGRQTIRTLDARIRERLRAELSTVSWSAAKPAAS